MVRGLTSVRVAAALGIVATILPGVVQACPNCTAAADNRVEFLVTTAFMSLLPMLVIGGAVYWLRKRVAALERENAATERHLSERAP